MDALNATLRTFNGNELVLQNEMGNTMIQDSTTGNIMGLRDGFVPVGMKEYGGILYIASYNQHTNEGELGTIPSPVINYTYNTTPYVCDFKDTEITNIDSDISSNSLITDLLPKYLKEPFQISDKRFQVGDQFIINLNLSNTVKTKRNCRYYLGGKETKVSTEYPLISGFKEDTDSSNSEIKDYGWFKIILEAKVERSSDTINLSNISSKRQKFYTESYLGAVSSRYWFISETDKYYEADSKTEIPVNKDKEGNIILDTERCQADDQYRTYPNILPGYLYVHAEAELPENFEFFKNNSTGIKSPNIFLITI